MKTHITLRSDAGVWEHNCVRRFSEVIISDHSEDTLYLNHFRMIKPTLEMRVYCCASKDLFSEYDSISIYVFLKSNKMYLPKLSSYVFYVDFMVLFSSSNFYATSQICMDT